MPLDSRWYIHPKDCQCPECEWHRHLKGKDDILPPKEFPLKPIPDKQREDEQHNPPPKLPPKLPRVKGENSNKWLVFLVVIACLIFVGFIINQFTGSLIPFWLLLGFLILLLIQQIRKGKPISSVYKLILNLSILSLFGFLVWSGIKLFSHQFLNNPIIGSITFIEEFVLFIWIGRIISRNSRQRPSMKLTIFCIVAIFLILAFAGVAPFSEYKDAIPPAIDNLITKWNAWSGERTEQQRAEQVPIPTPTLAPRPTPAQTTMPTIAPTVIIPSTSYQTLFNNYRQQHGLSPLTFTEDLNQIAQIRVREIQQNFSHEGILKYNLAENIVRGVRNDQEALDAWDKSSGHKANMLNISYKNTGYAISSGFAVQVFSGWDTINGIPQLPPGWYFPK